MLSNTAVTSVIQEIALPPSTAYQKVTINSLTPPPLTVISDKEGNWLARYEVRPRQNIAVSAKATVAVYLSARSDFQTPSVTKKDYLSEAPYWQTNNESIKRLAARFTTPRQIYDYVASSLTYDFAKVNASATRMGAVAVLNAPDKAVCMEFTDLFVAISRAAGIPARRLVGYAYTNNPKLRPLSLVSDVLHAWPEYYDEEQRLWVPVDPTWANTTGGVDYFTKLDFNHIVFAINGIDSATPYPVGYYRSPDTLGRDVNVEFSPNPKDKVADITTTIEFPTVVGAGTKVAGNIVISNKGGESAYNIAVSVFSDPGNIKVTQVIPELLPYAVVRIPITGVFDQSITSKPGQIRARVNDVTLTHTFRIQPLYWLIGLAATFFILASIIAVRLISLFIWKIFRKR